MNHKSKAGLLAGLLFLLLGAGYLARAFGIFEFTVFFKGWWTLFIIVPCFIGLLKDDDEDKLGYLIGVGIGVVLLLSCRGLLDSDKIWLLILAVVCLVVGIKCIFPERKRKSSQDADDNEGWTNVNFNHAGTRNTEDNNVIDAGSWKEDGHTEYFDDGKVLKINAIFNGRDVRVDNTIFNGADISTVFGGVDLNLKNAVIRKDVVIDLKTIFGGVSILVPSGVRVVVEADSVFGSTKNTSGTPLGADQNTPTVYVRGICLFGEIKIK